MRRLALGFMSWSWCCYLRGRGLLDRYYFSVLVFANFGLGSILALLISVLAFTLVSKINFVQ